jgi:hypothetical protein
LLEILIDAVAGNAESSEFLLGGRATREFVSGDAWDRRE